MNPFVKTDLGKLLYEAMREADACEWPDEWSDVSEYWKHQYQKIAQSFSRAIEVDFPLPVAWCELTKAGQIAYFDGKPMVMPGPVGNDCHPVALYAMNY